MENGKNDGGMLVDRRILLRRWAGVAAVGGIAALAGCGDGGPAATPTPSPTPTATPAAVPGPSYAATDADRLNFLLQVDYLLAAYLSATVLGRPIAGGLTTGTGAAGNVAGATSVGFASATLAAQLREITQEVVARISGQRRRLGAAATAQPAINLAATGADAPFVLLSPEPQGTTTPNPNRPSFDPYRSESEFLVGAVLFTGVATTAFQGMIPWMSDRASIDLVMAMMTTAARHDAVVRAELWRRVRADAALTPRPAWSFEATVNDWSARRDALNNRPRDRGVGNADNANIAPDDRGVTIFRTPEQVLNIVYGNRTAVPQGAFFPDGVNGTIRYSGANAATPG